MIHNYELGLLNPMDTEKFELHLYECDYCATQIEEFREATRLVLADDGLKSIASELVTKSDTAKGSRKITPIFRYLIAAALVLAIAIPVYYSTDVETLPGVSQVLELNPARSGSNNVIYLDQEGDVEINFFIADGYTGTVDLVITTIEGDTIMTKTGMSVSSTGSVRLPISSLKAGHYILKAMPASDEAFTERIYMFSTK